jgi:hypothetical protein
MSRIFVPSNGPGDWRRLLAAPGRQWKRGKSAFESAILWEGARRNPRGLPAAIASALDSHPRTRSAVLVLAIPELLVDLPGGGHASQNDVWALLRTGRERVSLSVEAKSGERLDELVGEWLADAKATSGKPKRLEFLRECLGLDGVELSKLRYQLLHRAASALVQAGEFDARTAVLVVHSFGGHADDKSREDYERFAEAMACAPAFETLAMVGRPTRLPLLIGWLNDVPAAAEAVARADSAWE